MKSLAVLFLFTSLTNQAASAKRVFELPSAKIEELRQALMNSAVNSHLKTKDLDKAIKCMVDRISNVAQNDKSVEAAIRDIEWSTRFYQRKLSQAEIEEDPEVMLENLTEVFAPNCLR